jgi:hypothetical protein
MPLLGATERPPYVVVEENSLGYLVGEHSVGILASGIGGPDPKNGPIARPRDPAELRPATREDFERFRVSAAGHLEKTEPRVDPGEG